MERHQGKNLGGVKSILLAQYSKVIVPEGELIGFSQIILTGGTAWTGVPFTLESAFWAENEKRTFNGLFYEKELEFSIPAIREAEDSLRRVASSPRGSKRQRAPQPGPHCF